TARRRTVPSAHPVRKCRPSGLNATAWTGVGCHSGGLSGRHFLTGHELRQALDALHRLGREGLASQFLTSTAYRTLQVTADYERLLHRAPTSLELSDWVNSGLDLLSIQIGIESTPGF